MKIAYMHVNVLPVFFVFEIILVLGIGFLWGMPPALTDMKEEGMISLISVWVHGSSRVALIQGSPPSVR